MIKYHNDLPFCYLLKQRKSPKNEETKLCKAIKVLIAVVNKKM